MTPLLLVLPAAFLGSFHCAAMCGPFVAGYAVRGGSLDWQSHLAYQGGRLSAYLGLGLLMGLLGQGVLKGGRLLELQGVMFPIIGGILIALGLSFYLPKNPGGGPNPLLKQFYRAMGGLHRLGNGPAVAGLFGLTSALLPCGYLYGFAISAGATGDPLRSVAVMALFWLGSLPALLFVGTMGQWAGAKGLRRLERLTPLFMVLFGILALFGKWTAAPGQGPDETWFCLTP